MNTSKLNWWTWLEQGDQYLKASTPKNSVSRFGTDIRYNLISMSLESYIMAILDYHKTLPDNHTFTDLLYALELVMPLNEQLKKRILHYESIQSICSIDKYQRVNPTEGEILDLKAAIVEISVMAHNTCVSVTSPVGS
jgi:hypothetical protein